VPGVRKIQMTEHKKQMTEDKGQIVFCPPSSDLCPLKPVRGITWAATENENEDEEESKISSSCSSSRIARHLNRLRRNL
jgi:hypothetical protein